MCDSIEVLKILLQARASPDISNEYGETPLSIAELHNAYGAPAQILRDYGAKVRSFCGRQTCIGFGGLFALRYLIMVLGSQPTGIRQNQEGSLWQSMAEIPAQSGKVTLREDPQSSGNAEA